MKKQIPFLELVSLHRSISKELNEKFNGILEKGVFAGGADVVLFENNVSDFLKLPASIACSNGTDALELALKALDTGPGDEVIVPALTWVSTAEAVVNVGAKPVFCDVDREGLIDLREAEKLVSTHTKCLIPVHLYGNMVDMFKLMDFANKHRLKVVEDAAQAFGAFQEGRSAGLFGDIGCFSFYPTKNLGALGEAGLLTTRDKKMEQRIRCLLNHGQTERDVHQLVGGNSKMDPLQAGFLDVKLRHFPQWQKTRKLLASLYLLQLKGLRELILPHGIGSRQHNAHLFTIRLERRDDLREYLARQGIGTAIHYPRILPQTPAFYTLTPFPVAEEISRTTLSLPLHPFLKEEEVEIICRKIKRFLMQDQE